MPVNNACKLILVPIFPSNKIWSKIWNKRQYVFYQWVSVKKLREYEHATLSNFQILYHQNFFKIWSLSKFEVWIKIWNLSKQNEKNTEKLHLLENTFDRKRNSANTTLTSTLPLTQILTR